MRRVAKWLGWTLAVLIGVPILLVGLVIAAANTGVGQREIERLTPQLTGDTVRLSGLSGRFPDALRVAHAELRDPQGAYTTLDDLALDWSPLQLLHWRIVVDQLAAAHIDVIRMPASSSSSSGGISVPAPVTLRDLHVTRIDIGAPITGTAAAIALDGSGEISAADTFRATLNVRQLGGSGSYTLTAASDTTALHATLNANEPVHGLVANIAGLPELGGLSVTAQLDGPKDALATHATVQAGPLHASADGTLDLVHQAADLTLTANAPQMQPRPDIAWQAVALDAHVHGPLSRPDANGRLRVDRLSAAGAAASINATISGNAGALQLNAEVTDLHLPLPNADLLAGAPLTIRADAALDAPDRPVRITVRHPLLVTDADARIGATRSLDATVRIADIAPFAAMGQVDLQGGLTLALHALMQGDTTTVNADGTVGITGGQQQAHALVGDAGRFTVAATVHGNDLTLSQLQFTGQGASLSANGSVTSDRVDLSWSLAVSDLAAAEPSLAGQLQANGKASGTTDNLNLTADISGGVATRGMTSGQLRAHIEASGLPSNPSGRITAQGDLLDAPVDLAVGLQRRPDGFGIDIERATWKSFQAGGTLALPTATMVPAGSLHIAMERLADLTPVVGRKLAGSLNAALDASPDNVHVTMEMRGADLAGTAAASRVALVADVAQPQSHPTVDAKLDVEGARASGIAATLHATVNGPTDALGVKLSASLPDLYGSAGQLSATATADAVGRSVTLASLQGEWHQQTIRLLAPVRVALANGVAIDRLRLGLRQAVVEVSGRVSPTLDLTASLRNLPADLAAALSPAYAADGTVQADARITGSSARPVGKLHLVASGLRARTGPGRALPPANITGDAELNGTEAQIDVRLAAGKSRLNVTGRAPLGQAGSLNLRAGGSVDLALLDPITTASGRRVRGQITLDTTITGSVAAPSVGGFVQLADGEVQDYVSGLHLANIAARLDAQGAALRITRLSATAGPGTITMAGTVGVREPGIPLDLTLTARNAEPLASDLMTARLDANLTVRGEAFGQLTVAGDVHVQRAEIRVPERMPSSIAVLPVHQPGAKPAPPAAPSVIALNLTLDARQVFVRGRGLDTEFGGSMKITGTASAPQTVGGLELRRGTLSVAGHTLTFTEGRITFNGGSMTDPALHLVATSTSASVLATLTIEGTAHAPKIILSSVPSLPQDEVLANLLFGKGIGQLGALEVAEIAAGLATLTGAGGGIGDPLDKVRQGLGLDRLSVTNGANGSPALEAGRYIAPRVYLGAKQSASGGSQASVQVDITKGLKLEATAGAGGGSATGAAGASNGTSVGLTYQFEY